MNPYYYVYRLTNEMRGPKIKHLTLESAQTEAERLANQHPASVFEILKAVAIVHCTVASTFWMDGEFLPEPAEEPARYPKFHLPKGYDRWVCRGIGWTADKANYCTWDAENKHWNGQATEGSANGLTRYEYWEAVKDTTEESYRSLELHETLQKGDQLLNNGNWIPARDSVGLELGKSEFPAARRPL